MRALNTIRNAWVNFIIFRANECDLICSDLFLFRCILRLIVIYTRN